MRDGSARTSPTGPPHLTYRCVGRQHLWEKRFFVLTQRYHSVDSGAAATTPHDGGRVPRKQQLHMKDRSAESAPVSVDVPPGLEVTDGG